MKYIIFFFLVSTAAIVMPNMLGQTKQSPAKATADSTKLYPNSIDSISWFEANLNLYIQADYFTFDPALYTQGLTKEAKAELSLDCWLGSFTISDMFKEKNYLKIDFSASEFTKVMYITKTFFVLTSYNTSENGMDYGSSLLYEPNTNTLKELGPIIVYSINNNSLECSREQITQDGFLIEHGHYDVSKRKFVVEFVE